MPPRVRRQLQPAGPTRAGRAPLVRLSSASAVNNGDAQIVQAQLLTLEAAAILRTPVATLRSSATRSPRAAMVVMRRTLDLGP